MMLACMLALNRCCKACNCSVPSECTVAVCGNRCQSRPCCCVQTCLAGGSTHLTLTMLLLLYRFLLDALHLQYKKNMTALGEKWNPPWTEFNLYWIYATQAEVFEDWHVTDVVSTAANTGQRGKQKALVPTLFKLAPLQHAAEPCNIVNGQGSRQQRQT